MEINREREKKKKERERMTQMNRYKNETTDR